MASKPTTQEHFDPNSTALSDSGIFGLPFSASDARLHLLGIPWEVTTSYGKGAARGPEAILRASHQVDLFDIETGEAWRPGIYLQPLSEAWALRGRELKELAQERLEALLAGDENSSRAQEILRTINGASRELNAWVESEAKRLLVEGRLVGLIGGDHSTPFGLIRALNESLRGDMGVLHVDAHADLREAYQGYEHSHASIMFNVTEQIRPKTLVQVGIRDFGRAEYEYSEAHRSSGRIHTHYDRNLKRALEDGTTWTKLVDRILEPLPQNVYLSFDIDGLDPALCPHTGTPVPGGLSYDQAATLIARVVESGRRLVGFDLNEVAEVEDGEAEWDANVGARLLFKMCGWAMISQGLVEMPPSRGRA